MIVHGFELKPRQFYRVDRRQDIFSTSNGTSPGDKVMGFIPTSSLIFTIGQPEPITTARGGVLGFVQVIAGDITGYLRFWDGSDRFELVTVSDEP